MAGLALANALERDACRECERGAIRLKFGRGPSEECFDARPVVELPLASDE